MDADYEKATFLPYDHASPDEAVNLLSRAWGAGRRFAGNVWAAQRNAEELKNARVWLDQYDRSMPSTLQELNAANARVAELERRLVDTLHVVVSVDDQASEPLREAVAAAQHPRTDRPGRPVPLVAARPPMPAKEARKAAVAVAEAGTVGARYADGRKAPTNAAFGEAKPE